MNNIFKSQIDLPEDFPEIYKLIAKHKLEDSDNIREVELNYKDEEELWELHELNYSLAEKPTKTRNSSIYY